MNSLSIILPCAGAGSRLGLNYPKELYEIIPDKRLIDFSLDHIINSIETIKKNKIELKIIIVTTKEKIVVFEYVKQKMKNFTVKMVEFNPIFEEWPGSVYSANEEFSDGNIVLLPDTFLSLSPKNRFKDENNNNLIDNFNILFKKSKVIFGIVNSTDKYKLKNLGAVKLSKNKIIKFMDKPDRDFHLYNGFWGTYGFTKTNAFPLYNFLIKNLKKENNLIEKEGFFPPLGFTIYNHLDLGTWDSIDEFRIKNKFNKNKKNE